MHAIETAEDGQRCGHADGGTWDCAEAATARLRAFTAGRTVTCDAVDRDRYGRTVAACRVGDTDVQELLTREGLAWAYRQYSRAYVSAEEAARAERRGIWQGPAKPPWEWRRGQPTGGDCVERLRAGRLQDQGQHQQPSREDLPHAGVPLV
jgi:endonuclease YncB( thermonuclease family)